MAKSRLTTKINSEKYYLCKRCGAIRVAEHEDSPGAGPYVSGDCARLS